MGLFVKNSELILKKYIEVESGKDDLRGDLHKAIAHAKTSSATLLIAKLDRLSRNVAFIFALKEAGVEFICADMPQANTLTIGIFAVLAQHERELISSRTKAALQEKAMQLARVGERLGTPANLTEAARKKGVDLLQTQYKRLTNPQWEVTKQYLPLQHKRKYDLRFIIDAILWYLRIGSQWHNLPKDFPK